MDDWSLCEGRYSRPDPGQGEVFDLSVLINDAEKRFKEFSSYGFGGGCDTGSLIRIQHRCIQQLKRKLDIVMSGGAAATGGVAGASAAADMFEKTPEEILAKNNLTNKIKDRNDKAATTSKVKFQEKHKSCPARTLRSEALATCGVFNHTGWCCPDNCILEYALEQMMSLFEGRGGPYLPLFVEIMKNYGISEELFK